MRGQLALFEITPPPDLTHDWLVRPLGPNECACCLTLWFSGTSHEQAAAFLTEPCPVKTADSRQHAPAIVYLA